MSTPSPSRKEPVSTAITTAGSTTRALPPVLGRLLSGTFWLAAAGSDAGGIRPLDHTPRLAGNRPRIQRRLQVCLGFWLLPDALRVRHQFRARAQISDSWTRGDRQGVDRAVSCGLNFYAATALVQVAALLGVAYWALPHSKFAVDSRSVLSNILSLQLLGDPNHGISVAAAGFIQAQQYRFIVKLLWLQVLTAPCYGLSVVISSVLQAARRYDFIPASKS